MTGRTARTQRLALPFLLAAIVAATACNDVGHPRGAIARAGAPGEARTASSASTDEAPSGNTQATTTPEARRGRVASLAQDAEAIARGPSLSVVGGYMRVFERPDRRSQMIGLVRAGQSVPLAAASPLTTDANGQALASCSGGWYAVAPRGFACAAENGTLDASDPRVLAAREVLPDVARATPFDVGVAVGSPTYLRAPSAAEQRDHETGLDAYLQGLAASPLGPIDSTRADRGPSDAWRAYEAFAKKPLVGEKAFAGRRVAWARAFDADGRTFLETPDLGLLPKDKVRPVVGSSLEGIDLRASPDMRLPLVFTLDELRQLTPRAPPLRGQSTLAETGVTVPRHTFVPIEGDRVYVGGRAYWKTRDGFYLSAERTNVFTARTKPPYTVKKGSKWIDVRVLGGTLVAYEGTEPVYVAAISAGRDGVTVRPRSHTTLPGLYQVQWKLFTADMSGREGATTWAVDEVPFVAYFYESLALHGAYWHDEFGRPRSHGCVNLSPRSAQWLFDWMDPEVPRGWYAVAGYGPGVPITVVDVRP